jgi:hypothetical protein
MKNRSTWSEGPAAGGIQHAGRRSVMHRPRLVAALVVSAALPVTGCPSTGAPCTGSACADKQTDVSFQEQSAYPMDVLIVVDDSPSMASKQGTVEALADALAQVSGNLVGRNDLRFLVVTSSSAPGCPRPGAAPRCASDRVLRWGQVCGQPPNFTGALADAIACATAVGAEGCGVEQPLAAMQAALENKIDPSFPRANTPVFVVVVSDEDDCSTPAGLMPTEAEPGTDDPAGSTRCRDADQRGELVPVDDYVRFLQTRDRPSAVSVVASLPAPRLERLALALNGSITRLDAANLAPAFAQYGQRLAVQMGNPCLPPEIVDHDPGRPGLQPECTVTEGGPEAGGTVERPLPRCETSAPPCWRVESEVTCPSGGAWVIDHGSCTPPAVTTFKASCLAGEPGQ